MRKPFIVGNWKMNMLNEPAVVLAKAVAEAAKAHPGVEVAVAPPATSLAVVLDVLRDSPVAVATQNCHWESAGAFTGELSPEMIKDMGCSHVIIGHSERRQYFGETDETVNQKVHAALRAGLMLILCIGETLEERESAKTFEVLERQLRKGLAGLDDAALAKVTIAYEPVWAIGTGLTATPEQAQEVHAKLRAWLGDLASEERAGQMRIQYGGSVKPSNVKELMSQTDIDGALVGGASLKPDSFAGILAGSYMS